MIHLVDSKIKYTEERNELKIEIFPKLKKIVTFGYLFFYVLPFSIFTILFAYILQSNNIQKNKLFIICIIFGSLTIAFIFLRRIFEKEVVIITRKELIIKKVMIITLNKKKYNLKYIKDFIFAGREDFTEHYLNVKGFDYLGIGTGEKEVHFMIEGGNIQFEYLGTKVRFGQGVYFDEVDELIQKLKKYISTNSPTRSAVPSEKY